MPPFSSAEMHQLLNGFKEIFDKTIPEAVKEEVM